MMITCEQSWKVESAKIAWGPGLSQDTREECPQGARIEECVNRYCRYWSELATVLRRRGCLRGWNPVQAELATRFVFPDVRCSM